MGCPKACPYIIFSVTLTLGIVMAIAGCAVKGNWWVMFIAIPSALSIILGLAVFWSLSPEYEAKLMGPNGFIYLCAVMLVCVIGLPIVMWHCELIPDLTMGLAIGGAAVIVAGCVAFVVVQNKDDDGY